MSDAHKPSDERGDEPGETQIERGARAPRARADSARKAGSPAFEETFAADDASDAGEPPTLLWSSSEAEQALRAAEEELEHGELTQTLLDSELSEVTSSTQPREPAAPSASDPHAWYLGRSFGGFRIVRAIAAGGMATVFLARKEGPSRVSKHAAIKVVHPHLAYEREFVHMFLDEARIAALIDHPNVCRVLDFGMAEGTYYLAMEYLLGESWSTVRNALAEHPDGARMLPAVSAHVLAQACEGLYAAHEALDDSGYPLAIVHRDVSPQNIFVAYDGTVRVLDFGIARAADRITSTRDGVLKGRLAYMSPEQMSIAEVGPAADIWSVGVVLREALEGKRLFRRASDAETMLAVTQEELPPWNEGVPEALRTICDRALSRDPSARQANARELAAELAQFAQNTRSQVGSSELSVWMGLLFGAQMEQKRALLQLPLPEPREGGAPIAPPILEEAEPSEASMPVRGPATLPARPEKKKFSLVPPWLNPPALVALASAGAIVGVLLGRIMHRDPVLRERRASGAAESAQTKHARPAPAASEAVVGKPVVDQLAPSVHQIEPTVLPLATPRAKVSPSDPGPPDPRPKKDSAPVHGAPVAQTGGKSAAQAPASVQATGTLLVAFEGGWAEISLGERRLGTTPGRFVVPAGKQTLSVRPFGTGKAFAKRVELAPNQVLKVFLAAPKP
jgi:serine/threonine protein kinase